MNESRRTTGETVRAAVRTIVAGSLCMWVTFAPLTLASAGQGGAPCFDIKDVAEPNGRAPRIEPWKTVPLDPDYGGQWVVAGDVDGDGHAEIVSAENVNKDDVHYTSAAAAQRLDGSVLWRWGEPGAGRKQWHHDVACQIHDWDGDGKAEVVLCTKGHLVELDGATGKQRRSIAIDQEATDCLVFCNLSGASRPSDILVKDRYHRIWAYDGRGNLLWSVKDPGGYPTAHQPRPIDIDNDGRDEVMAGYAMLNHDGSVRWVLRSKQAEQGQGHLDCCRVFSQGAKVEDLRLVLTCCGADNVAMLDGTGKVLWEISGHHFESVDVGRVLPDRGSQLVVDIDHRPPGESPLWVLDEKGRQLGQIVTSYSRHHCLVDWTGDGLDEIIVGGNGAIYDYRGLCIAVLAIPAPRKEYRTAEISILAGDMNADGVPDVMLVTPEAVHIFRNERGSKAEKAAPVGTELNLTLY